MAKPIQLKNRINIVFPDGKKIDILYTDSKVAEQDFNQLKSDGEFMNRQFTTIELL